MGKHKELATSLAEAIKTKADLIGLLDTLRIDAILEDNELDQDELGQILGLLGVEEYQ